MCSPWSLKRHCLAPVLPRCTYVLQYPERPQGIGGEEEIFRRDYVQIGIVKVDSLERSKQHRNMHRLSTCHRDRRVTDTVPQTRAQISDIRRARADSVRSLKHAGTCTLPPQGHGWATLPPRGTATCKMGVHRLPKSGSSHNRTHPQPRTCTQCRSLETCPCHPAKLPSPPLPPCRHPTGQSGHGRRILRAVDRHHDVEERQTTK